MLYFPQLVSGAVAQYPVLRRRLLKTVVLRAADQSRWFYGDQNAHAVRWDLRFEGLTDAELAGIETLFMACEGRLRHFLFLDPTENLLAWTEAYGESAWNGTDALQITYSQTDPTGSSRAIRIANLGSTEAVLSQRLRAPGAYHYCFSLYIRNATGSPGKMFMESGGRRHEVGLSAGHDWTRMTCGTNLESSSNQVVFGVQLPPGSALDLYGLQAEAQLLPSPYKRTFERCGLHPKARFLHDTLTTVAVGPNSHSCEVSIISSNRD